MPPPDAWASDILVSVALALFAAYLEFQPPFERHLVSETLHRVSFPHTPKQTFPTWTLPCLGVFIPVSIIFLASLAPHARVDRARHRSQTQRAVVGLLLAVTLGFAVTNALKNAVGAFRPDFKTRCWPNDAPVRWASTGVPTCSPGHDERLVSEGRKSFPSGHASMAFSGLTFAARVVANRVGLGAAATAARGNKQGAWRLVATISPLILALFVAVSRVTDYMHHVEDVVVGGAIGVGAACAAWETKTPFADDDDFGVAGNGSGKKKHKDGVFWVKKQTANRPPRRRGLGCSAHEDHAPAGTRR
jgi:membrane-associated phospholipid phosphatase